MKSLLYGLEAAVIGMILLRMLSGIIEVSAAFLMLRFGTIEKAMTINALLAIIGPIVLISTMSIGLISLSDKISTAKFLLIGVGVVLILIGLRK